MTRWNVGWEDGEAGGWARGFGEEVGAAGVFETMCFN